MDLNLSSIRCHLYDLQQLEKVSIALVVLQQNGTYHTGWLWRKHGAPWASLRDTCHCHQGKKSLEESRPRETTVILNQLSHEWCWEVILSPVGNSDNHIKKGLELDSWGMKRTRQAREWLNPKEKKQACSCDGLWIVINREYSHLHSRKVHLGREEWVAVWVLYPNTLWWRTELCWSSCSNLIQKGDYS